MKNDTLMSWIEQAIKKDDRLTRDEGHNLITVKYLEEVLGVSVPRDIKKLLERLWRQRNHFLSTHWQEYDNRIKYPSKNKKLHSK